MATWFWSTRTAYLASLIPDIRAYLRDSLRRSWLGRINTWWRRLFSCGGSAYKVMIRRGG